MAEIHVAVSISWMGHTKKQTNKQTHTQKTSTGPYRSCAALKDISIPLKYLVEFSFVWFGLVGMV